VIASKARIRGIKKIEKALGYHIPDAVFHGAFLEAVTSRLNIECLDGPLRVQLLEFFREFLMCDCKDNPQCGCPEKRFALRIIELREEGLDHYQISNFLSEEYGIDMYPADILSFLEYTVHMLEAIQDIASLQGKKSLLDATKMHIKKIAQ